MNPIDPAFVKAHAAAFEDFWNRRLGDSFFELRYPAFGYAVHVETNAAEVLDAARMSAPRYARSQPLAGSPDIELRVVVAPEWNDTPVPADLPASIQTIGFGATLFQAATPWLQWTTNLETRRMTAFISRSLAAEPRLVSRYLLDRATTNLLLYEGVGQLHATSLMRGDDAVLFVAPHGTGKSTTAFHLLTAGYRLMGDGLLFLRERDGKFELMGYPAGEAKLTPAMQPLFPEWRGAGDEATVHNVVKSIVDLRDLSPGSVIEDAVFPKRIILCIAERDAGATTRAVKLTPLAALERLLPDTIYWDEADAMVRSLGVIQRLVERAACYRLTLGQDRRELVETIVGLG